MGLIVGLVLKLTFFCVMKLWFLIQKMSSVSPGCEFDGQFHLCLLEAMDLTPKLTMFV